MLISLTVKDYAIIESLELNFVQGFSILTGETGAGKSIIIGALGMVLGERTTSNVIRHGATRCEVAACFDIKKIKDLPEVLKEFGIEFDDELIIRREVSAEGRSRAFVNSVSVTLNVLEKIGNLLVDVHGQHSHQTLVYPEEQRSMVDRYGKLTNYVNNIAGIYTEYSKLLQEKQKLDTSENERLQKIDLYKFQLQEISNATLTDDNEEQLEQEYNRLANAEKLAGFINNTVDSLSENESSVLSQLHSIKQNVEAIQNIDSSISTLLNELQNSLYKIEDLSGQVKDYKNKVEFNPQKLDDLADRRELIRRLKKKYGATIKNILEYYDKTSAELNKLEHSEESKQQIEVRLNEVKQKLVSQAKELTELREKVSAKLEKEIVKQLSEVGLEKAKFYIKISPKTSTTGELEVDATGADIIEFHIAANPGEGVKPLAETASGGELSRIMLALKTVFAQADKIPVLIFYFFFVGIGGTMAKIVGQKIFDLSKTHQVISITHMPQIAVYGNLHLHVDKTVRSGRTFTTVKQLDSDVRVEEIARMLGGGEKPSKVTLQHAKELLENSK